MARRKAYLYKAEMAFWAGFLLFGVMFLSWI